MQWDKPGHPRSLHSITRAWRRSRTICGKRLTGTQSPYRRFQQTLSSRTTSSLRLLSRSIAPAWERADGGADPERPVGAPGGWNCVFPARGAPPVAALAPLAAWFFPEVSNGRIGKKTRRSDLRSPSHLAMLVWYRTSRRTDRVASPSRPISPPFLYRVRSSRRGCMLRMRARGLVSILPDIQSHKPA